MTDAIQLGKTKPVKTLGWHYKAFAKTHPLELSLTHSTEELTMSFERREIFVLTNDILPCEVAIDITGIKQALSKRQLPFQMHEGELTEAWIDYTMQSSGIEEEGVKRLAPVDLRRPGIMIWWQGTDTTMVDGNHRLIRRWRDGMRTFSYALVQVTYLRDFIAPSGTPPRSFIKAMESKRDHQN